MAPGDKALLAPAMRPPAYPPAMGVDTPPSEALAGHPIGLSDGEMCDKAGGAKCLYTGVLGDDAAAAIVGTATSVGGNAVAFGGAGDGNGTGPPAQAAAADGEA